MQLWDFCCKLSLPLPTFSTNHPKKTTSKRGKRHTHTLTHANGCVALCGERNVGRATFCFCSHCVGLYYHLIFETVKTQMFSCMQTVMLVIGISYSFESSVMNVCSYSLFAFFTRHRHWSHNVDLYKKLWKGGESQSNNPAVLGSQRSNLSNHFRALHGLKSRSVEPLYFVISFLSFSIEGEAYCRDKNIKKINFEIFVLWKEKHIKIERTTTWNPDY